VVLERMRVLGFVPHRGTLECLLGIAAIFGVRRAVFVFRIVGFGALGVEIGDMRLARVFDSHERGRVARNLGRLGDHQRNRLTAEMDLGVA
jgi:hypothetical protein